MLKHRVLTAAILMALILAMMWLLPPSLFRWCIMPFFALGAWEWSGLAGLATIWPRLSYVGLVLVIINLAYFIHPIWLFAIAGAMWLWASMAICVYQRQQGLGALGWEKPWVKGVAGFIMLPACWAGVAVLQEISPILLLMVLILIWSVDTGGYFGGRRWGKRPLASRISPKKTWEGFYGGILSAVVIMTLISVFFTWIWQQHLLFVGLTLICALLAVAGDLLVSLLKREIGIKDTGVWFPGHGGLLDRCDSTISAVPVFALGFLLFLC